MEKAYYYRIKHGDDSNFFWKIVLLLSASTVAVVAYTELLISHIWK